ncbi:mucin-2-like [Trachinotus anak]|uniref:mucin-2-like n=1 Tax=Trachinotus anak TaxID=443729 RepID=UPI0039F17CF4
MKWRWPVLLLLTGLCSLIHSITGPVPVQYHFISTTLPWLEAQKYCRERYTDLATIFDIEDMNRLVNTAQDSTGGFTQAAWIGLHDNLTSWRWSFSDSRYYTGEEGNYRNWDFGQPNNFLGDQMCVKMWTGGLWEDSKCSLRNPFICYDGATRTYERFVFVQEEMSWPDAQLYCRRRHTDLASIRDEKENQEIQLLAGNRSVWIGLYRTREWSDQSDSSYRYWKAGQPDNAGGQQSCIATDLGNAGLWSDERCDRLLAFICHGANGETSNNSLLSSTTESPNTRTTTEKESTTGHVSIEMTSSEQPSAPHVDPTTKTTNEPVLSTITTVNPNKITTTTRDSTSTTPGLHQTMGYFSTQVTSSDQPLTLEQVQTTLISDESSSKSVLSTTTVAPNKRTSAETESTSGPVTTEMTSSKQPSTSHVTPNQSVLATTPPATTNTITTTERGSTLELHQTQHYLSTQFTSSDQPSTLEAEQTTPIDDETPNKSLPATTTVTSNKSTISVVESSTGHLNTKMTSSEHPSTSNVDTIRPITDETPTKLPLATTTTMAQTRITTIKGDLMTPSVSGHHSTDITSSKQPSSSDGFQTRPITDESSSKSVLSTTTVAPNKRTSAETESTSGPVTTEMTSSKQPSTSYVTPNQSVLATTPPATTNKITTTERGSTLELHQTQHYLSTQFTSSDQPSTLEAEQTTPIDDETPNKSLPATTTVTSNKSTISVVESSTGHLNTKMTSSEHPSTSNVDTIRPITDETPTNLPWATTTTMAQTRITTIKGDLMTPSVSGHHSTDITSSKQPSSSDGFQTRPITDESSSKSVLSTTTVAPNKRTSAETESTSGPVTTEMTSSKQPSTSYVTPNQSVLATTPPATTNKITTTERGSTLELHQTQHYLSTQFTSSDQPSTLEAEQTTPIDDETPNKSLPATTTVTSNKSTISVVESSTGHLNTKMTSSEHPSTSNVDTIRPITDETPTKLPLATTTTMAQTRITTIKGDLMTPSVSGHHSTDITSSKQPSSSDGFQTRPITDESSSKSVLSTTTVAPNKRTSAETESTSGPVTTEMTSSKQPSTSYVTPNQSVLATTPPATTNKITTTERGSTLELHQTQHYLSTQFTSSDQPSTLEAEQTTPIDDETPNKSLPATTTVTSNKSTISVVESSTGHLNTKMTSSEHPSTSNVDTIRPITDETPTKLPLATTTTMAQTRITTIKGDLMTPSVSGHHSTDITSSKQPSSSDGFQTRPITDESSSKSVLSTTTVAPNKRTSAETESTSGPVTTEMTSSKQPSTSHVTPNQSVLATTPPATTNTITTTERGSTLELHQTQHYLSTQFTSSDQPSTLEAEQTTPIDDGHPNKPVLSTTVTQNKMTTIGTVSISAKITSKETPDNPLLSTTTLTSNKTTTTEIESTTGHDSTEITSSEQPLTSEVDQTRTVTSKTPNWSGLASTTTVTQNNITTEGNSTGTKTTSTEQLSTQLVDQTTSVPGKTPTLSTITTSPQNKTTTTDGDFTSSATITLNPNKRSTTEVGLITSHLSPEMTSSEQPSTPQMEQTRPVTEHVINLRVALTSKTQLSEDDIKNLVLVEFRNLLIEMGLSMNIKVGLRRTLN